MCFVVGRQQNQKPWKNRRVFKRVHRTSDRKEFVGPYAYRGKVRYRLGQKAFSSLAGWAAWIAPRISGAIRPRAVINENSNRRLSSAGIYVYRTLETARKETGVNESIIECRVDPKDFLVHCVTPGREDFGTYTKLIPVRVVK